MVKSYIIVHEESMDEDFTMDMYY